MKRLVCSLLCLAFVNLCAAQTTLPEFGVFTEAEKSIRECPFDKEADAVVILDEATADHDDQYRLIFTRRTRLKILKPKGNRYGDIAIRYYTKDDAEYISDIEAYTCNPNSGGAIKKVPQSAIFRQKINDRWSAVKIAMPEVQPGTIIEYKYINTAKNYSFLDDWYFQGELPVMHSHFWLSIMPNYEFTYRVYKSDQLPITIKKEKEGRVYYEMNNIAGLRDEPYMDAEKDYLQHVEFQLSGYQGMFGGTIHYMTNWDEVAREIMTQPSYGGQLNKNIPVEPEWLIKVKAIAPAYDRMAAVYNFVYKNLNWNGINSRGAVDGVKETWEKKQGSSGDINLLLINLLKETGLETYPLLVSERGHGKVNAELPFIDQFNKTMACVVIDGKKYVLDATGPYTPAFMIPFSVINTKALLVNKKKSSIISLIETEKRDRNFVNIQAWIDDNGGISGKAYIQSKDYARLTRMRAWQRDKDRFRDNYYTIYETGLKVDSLELLNLENDSLPLEQKFNFSIPPSTSGDYKLVNLNLFSGVAKNPFISDIRFTNIDFGCLQSHSVIEYIELPASLKIETLPKNIRMIMPDTSITFMRIMEAKDNMLQVKYEINFMRPVFTADEYEYVKEFYKKMASIMNEQIVLRKP
ncbi:MULTISPECIES: DUF3857 domain-containing protein [Niastella]|uniref:DUF3857 domain-containing protein n=1 Tax=Niastella soli TaxID=2821487 RepID=A0ABS3YWD2_9BACT|nr:DUF3857 domain-containing protein [Niastella soli]MBO9201822.1 DUF3857 domain-containing protein [Niastella soli]